MIRKQAERIQEAIADTLGVESRVAVLAWTGPSFWIWVAAGAVVAVLLFGVVGLGGAVGGALVGLTIGSWFTIATPYAVIVSDSETLLVGLDQPLLGRMKAVEILERRPRAADVISRDGRTLRYGDRELQLLFFWAGQADQVVAAAASETAGAENV